MEFRDAASECIECPAGVVCTSWEVTSAFLKICTVYIFSTISNILPIHQLTRTTMQQLFMNEIINFWSLHTKTTPLAPSWADWRHIYWLYWRPPANFVHLPELVFWLHPWNWNQNTRIFLLPKCCWKSRLQNVGHCVQTKVWWHIVAWWCLMVSYDMVDIGSGNGLLPNGPRSFTWTNADLLSVQVLRHSSEGNITKCTWYQSRMMFGYCTCKILISLSHANELTYWAGVTHICISKVSHDLFR